MRHFTQHASVPLRTLLVLLLCAFAFSACAEEQDPAVEQPLEEEAPQEQFEEEAGTIIADIEEEPEAFYGQTVTVVGEVADVYLNSFTLAAEGIRTRQLLVVVPADAQVMGGAAGEPEWAEEDYVEVTGTVREYVIADIEADFDWNLDPNVEIDYEEQEPAIIADQVNLTPRTEAANDGM